MEEVGLHILLRLEVHPPLRRSQLESSGKGSHASLSKRYQDLVIVGGNIKNSVE